MASAEEINSFKEFTGEQSDEVARTILEACENNLERAIELHFARAAAAESGSNGGMQVDDDGDVEVIEEEAGANNKPIVLDDADEEGIRRPIQPVRGRLVEESYEQSYGGPSRRPAHPIFEQFRDATSSSGLHRYPGDDVRFDTTENRAAARQTRRQKNLAEIFRPPIDILTRGDWDSLLQTGRNRGHWILINIQDAGEFECQVLNRDVWSNGTLKEVIKESLLFWQVYADTPEGRRISGYYPQLQKFPAIVIIDPRTGELITEVRSRDANDMITELSDFLSRYPTFDARDWEFVHSAAPAPEIAAAPEPSTSGANGILNGKRKEPLDVDTPDYQAKRLKKELNIRDDEGEKGIEKPKVELGPWESYVVSSTSDSKENLLVLRFPSGERHNLKLNEKCPLKAVFAFIERQGMAASDVALILLYPKREYNLSHAHLTLGDLEFSAQEMIHVDRIL